MRRLGTIDLGTNTVRLLVVEVGDDGRWRVIDEDQRITRLGEGLGARGALGEVPMARTAAAVVEYVARAERAGAADVRIVATSAVREATNGRAFADSLVHATGRRVEVVSGDEEARLTVRGIVAGLGRVAGSMVAFDIGGGSTEYILGRDGVVEAAISLRLGVVALAERHPAAVTGDLAAYRAMAGEISARLERELPPAIRSSSIDDLVGTAGTMTTLAALELGLTRYDPTRVQGLRLNRDVIEQLLDRLRHLSVEARSALPCLEPGRADVIIPGIAIALETMTCLGADSVLVSDWGLREGLIVDAIEYPRRAG